jgi:hypothetical protein
MKDLHANEPIASSVAGELAEDDRAAHRLPRLAPVRRRLAEQIGRLHVERVGDLHEGGHGGVGVTGLDLLPVAPVQLSARGGLLDGQGPSGAQLACIGGESTAEIGGGDRRTGHTPSKACDCG